MATYSRFVLCMLSVLGLLPLSNALFAESAASPNPMAPIIDDPALPRVLIVGDSISIGYTLPTRMHLTGKANVHRVPDNASSTGHGLARIEAWLGDGQWDVIHFNFGLHDAKLPPEGVRHTPPDIYEKNLRQLVARMEKTGANLIWGTTTPIPRGGNLAPNRKFASIDTYNAIAQRVMAESKITINDLHRVMLPHVHEWGRNNDVHFSEEGYKHLAYYVSKAIEVELDKRRDHLKSQDIESLDIVDDFRDTAYGRTPRGWFDPIQKRPNRGWIVDGNQKLRYVQKNQRGLLIYRGMETSQLRMMHLANGSISASFQKTEDESVCIGIAGRIRDESNYYLAQFRGNDRLELLCVEGGVTTPLDYVAPVTDTATRPTGMISLRRYREGQDWELVLEMQNNEITARLRDERGMEMARVSVRDSRFPVGWVGLHASRYAAASSFRIQGKAVHGKDDDLSPITKRIISDRSSEIDYPIARPKWDHDKLNTSASRVLDEYDVVVAGAGTGGFTAALQAARMGASVLLIEETDWIGGQMSCAGVTTMDEDGGYDKSPVRERGFYREFHESMVAYYQTLNKDPFVTYYAYPHQVEGGYEPKATRGVLYGFIDQVRYHGRILDVATRARVSRVHKKDQTVEGVGVLFENGERKIEKSIRCKVLIDATEYGDVIPLTGARYRSGNQTSDRLDLTALVQDHTWLAIVREYPEGVPDHLQIKIPPPGHELMQKRFASKDNFGKLVWGGPFKGVKGSRHWRSYFAWRGSADTESPLTGDRSSERHTQCGFNGGNDYPVTAATLEDPSQRAIDERSGIYKTLGALYYFQHVLRVPWSLAEDEGYATPYNEWKMRSLDIRPDLIPLAIHLPQQPYVREARRIIGVDTLKASDLGRYENAKHVTSSVAMGDYFMDLDHGKTAHQMEAELDHGELPRGGGPFQIPFEVFLPETIDGFLVAEKNISQSRLANGATRLQPITMLTGQAAGTIAALAVQKRVQPRYLPVRTIQAKLLEEGSTLIQRWHRDVSWGTPLWQATQLLALHGCMDRPGPLTQDAKPLGVDYPWGIEQTLSRNEFQRVLQKLGSLYGKAIPEIPRIEYESMTVEEVRKTMSSIDPRWGESLSRVAFQDDKAIKAGEFALYVADILTRFE